MTLVRFTVVDGCLCEAEMPPPELSHLAHESWEEWLNKFDRSYFIETTHGQRVQLRHIVRAFRWEA